ncbi:hypothetical protein EV207_111100 [Scopulibacillus darangshiensis]|uniref:Uncharacterized protein n=1 Tax=Scopulibacillus darangshiensis TaxID=442528 RepID=A0A4R2P531_9BACL|nr:DUF5342 family protein [Scopulibacillus darangshiensis]TCP29298.1 hypothetical protein EV207_111100 [Scopulibacillus darangshiensis]
MISHFTYKPFLSAESRRREYLFSFFFKGKAYKGIYRYNGAIEWLEGKPEGQHINNLQSKIHELMLFHEYDN